MEPEASLEIVDYVVIALLILISLGIGVLFAVKDFKNDNRVEYLLGGRRMFMLPVALSMFASFTSGASILGMTTDIYMYGAMPGLMQMGIGISYIYGVFSIVPLLHPLRLTSLYEYLQLRFHSRAVRTFAVVIGMLQTMCYMAIVLLTPALAFQAGAGLPMWMSVGLLGFIGTVYTTIGGIKSVVWTDAFQCLVMIGGIITIIIKGSLGNSIVGGGDAAWKISQAGGRTALTEFSPDPRDRSTLWGTVIGGSILWLATLCNQSSLQRISAMKSVKDAQKAFILNAVLFFIYCILLLGNAWVVYAYFVHVGCDPIKAGLIQNKYQLSPYFVMHAMKDVPAIRGIYLAMIFSGSLSSFSSGINAMAANTVEDLLASPLKNVKESTATFVAKVLVFFYGILIIGLAYGANSIGGQVTRMSIGSIGAWGGPIVGIFLLGALFPWTNKYGAFGGGVISIVFCMWLALGNQLYGRKLRTLPYSTTEKCFLNNSAIEVASANTSHLYFDHQKVNASTILNVSTGKYDPYSFGFFFYDISFEWYGFIGVFVSLVLGMIISCCTRGCCTKITDAKFLFPFVRKLWLLEPSHGEENVDMLADFGTAGKCSVTQNDLNTMRKSNIPLTA